MSAKSTISSTSKKRCAIYTRKSKEDEHKQEFGSLEAQREAGEAYIQSQRNAGWEASPIHYDDDGFTGANTDRPALQRLLSDIEHGRVDVVVVYKIDRLSRSLLDFARLIALLEGHHVSLAAVTQEFNTSTSIGRLVLNMLLSFAQFEREMIAERTRDKMRAARKRGKWIGGMIPLGYDVRDKKLVVNDDEAAQVSALFRMYDEEHSILKVVEGANDLGWRTKVWKTRRGHVRGGKLWTKSLMGRLLQNRTYRGKVTVDGELRAGEHEAIVDDETFARVGTQLAAGRNGRDRIARNLHGFLLRGLVRCKACGTAMVSSTGRSRGKDYRYYTCLSVRQRGTSACRVRSVAAGALEQFVVDRIRELARKPNVIVDTMAAIRALNEADMPALEAERRRLEHEQGQVKAELRALVPRLAEVTGAAATVVTERLGQLDERSGQIEARLVQLTASAQSARDNAIEPAHVSEALTVFDQVWDALKINERIRIVGLVVERVEFDGIGDKISVSYSPTGMALLHDETSPTPAEGRTAQ